MADYQVEQVINALNTLRSNPRSILNSFTDAQLKMALDTLREQLEVYQGEQVKRQGAKSQRAPLSGSAPLENVAVRGTVRF